MTLTQGAVPQAATAAFLRTVERLRLIARERRMLRRLDRCCHGGVVSDRLPLAYRLECANFPPPEQPQ